MFYSLGVTLCGFLHDVNSRIRVPPFWMRVQAFRSTIWNKASKKIRREDMTSLPVHAVGFAHLRESERNVYPVEVHNNFARRVVIMELLS